MVKNHNNYDISVKKGFHQQLYVDFHETFSHVIKHATIRLVLGAAIGRG